jgi:hypothetical protein
MLGRKERGQLELFIAGSLRGLIPDDHVLVRIDQGLDLEWLRAEVAGVYCADNGRPGIDPEGEEEKGNDPVNHCPDERAPDAGWLSARDYP